MNRQKVLFFSRDPGATNQMVAVRELLCETIEAPPFDVNVLRSDLRMGSGERPGFVVMAKTVGHTVWGQAGLVVEDWDKALASISFRDRLMAIESLLGDRFIDAVITGADDVDEADTVLLWQAAKVASIPTVAFLDDSGNLDVRFRDRTDGRLVFPNIVYCLDRDAADGLVALGLPKPRTRVIDNPHLARLGRRKPAPGETTHIRNLWGLGAGDQAVLFVSENTAEMAPLRQTGGWDELALLTEVIAGFAAGRPMGHVDPGQKKVSVIVRPHPRDTIGKYEAFRRPDGPRVMVSNAGTPLAAASAADLVVGMDSALLIEARLAGRPVISLVADSRFNRRFAATSAGAEP
ncbi:MAG: hypothetical protein EXQ90_08860 [Rhodospirillales bacterium]|nr:hypothetical protein [Rhodospirillales bacterium]